MEVDDEQFTDEGGGMETNTPLSSSSSPLNQYPDLSSNTLDSREVILQEQLEVYVENGNAPFTPENLHLQQQTMLDFFPTISNRDSSPSSSGEDVLEGSGSPSSSSGTFEEQYRRLKPCQRAILLMSRDKMEVAARLKQECIEHKKKRPQDVVLSQTLWFLLENLLNVNNHLEDETTQEWIEHLIAGGEEPATFLENLTALDTRSACCALWTKMELAYRCATCSFSACMALCSECFNAGDHRGHDYNIFRSSSGGACDCGDEAVTKPEGFCSNHRKNISASTTSIPPHMFIMFNQTIFHILRRLLYHLRDSSEGAYYRQFDTDSRLWSANSLLKYLQRLCEKNDTIVSCLTEIICSDHAYSSFNSGLYLNGAQGISTQQIIDSYEAYIETLDDMERVELPSDYPGDKLAAEPTHRTFLDEFVMWLVYYEFPPALSSFILSMRTQQTFKEHFIRAFVKHYCLIKWMLHNSAYFDKTCHGLVNVNAQLFLDSKLVESVMNDMPLLEMVVISLEESARTLLSKISFDEYDASKSFFCIHDREKRELTNFISWPFLSDLNSLMSHRSIAMRFIKNDWLRHHYFNYLAMYQYMNPCKWSTSKNPPSDLIEDTFFTSECQVVDSTVFNLLIHLTDKNNPEVMSAIKTLVNHATLSLCEWFKQINFSVIDPLPEVTSFHLVLHRVLILFLNHATRVLEMPSKYFAQTISVLALAIHHPLKAMRMYHETINPVEFMTSKTLRGYIFTSGFSLFSSDICLLQTAAANVKSDFYLLSAFRNFLVSEPLEISGIQFRREKGDYSTLPALTTDKSRMNKRLLNFLLHLCFVTANRTAYERSADAILEKDISAQLCIGDTPYSSLVKMVHSKDLMTLGQDYNLDRTIKKLSTVLAPKIVQGGKCQDGCLKPKKVVWEQHYDPIYVASMAQHSSDGLDAHNRYTQYFHKYKDKNVTPSKLWPPFRIPPPLPSHIPDPQKILLSGTFHAIVFSYLYKSVYDTHCGHLMLPYLIHLMELAVEFHVSLRDGDGGFLLAAPEYAAGEDKRVRLENRIGTWYTTDHVFRNATTVIPALSCVAYPSDNIPSDDEEGNSFQEPPSGELESSLPHLSLLPSSSTALHPPQHLSLLPFSSPPPLTLTLGSEIVPYFAPVTPETPLSPPLLPSLALPPPFSSSTVALPCFSTEEEEPLNTQHYPYLRSPNPRHPLLTGDEVGRCPPPREDTSSDDPGRMIIPIEESIVSLLLKLYDLVSGGTAYTPTFDTLPTSRHGTDLHFIGALLDKMGHYDITTRTYILKLLSDDSPQESSESQPPQEDKKKKKERIRLTQQRALAELYKGTEGAMYDYLKDAPLDESMDTSTFGEGRGYSQEVMDNIACSSLDSHNKEVLVMAACLTANTADCLRRLDCAVDHSYPLNERGQSLHYAHRRNSVLNRAKERYQALDCSNFHMSWFLWENSGLDFPVTPTSCGHFSHASCHEKYIHRKIREQGDNNNCDYRIGEYDCSTCRTHCNMSLPLTPSVRHYLRTGSLFVSSDAPLELLPASSLSEDIVTEIYTLIRTHTRVQSMSSLKGRTHECTAEVLESSNCVGLDSLAKRQFGRVQYVKGSKVFKLIYYMGYFSACVKSCLQRQVNNQKGGTLLSVKDEYPTDSWNPNLLVSVCLFDSVSLRLHHDAPPSSELREWMGDRWGQLTLHPALQSHPTYDHQAMTSDTPPTYQRSYNRRTSRFNRHACEDVSPPSDGRYTGLPVLPILSSDPVSTLLLLWITLPDIGTRGGLQCIFVHTYRLAIIKYTLSALRTLNTKQRRQAVCDSNSLLSPLLATVYGAFEQHDSTVFHRSSSELEEFDLLSRNVTHEDESLVDMRLRDIEYAKEQRRGQTDSEEELESGEEETERGAHTMRSISSDADTVELFIRGLCLDFLRTAALAKYQLYSVKLPVVGEGADECSALEQYLGVQEMYSICNSDTISNMVKERIPSVLSVWSAPLISYSHTEQEAFSVLLRRDLHAPPSLMELPKIYEFLFRYHRDRACKKCNSKVDEPLLCLLCSAVLCHEQRLSLEDEEADRMTVQLPPHSFSHAVSCGGGECVFIAINSTRTVIVSMGRFLFWGSLYLDINGEADLGIRRGTTLRLNKERFSFLNAKYAANSLNTIVGEWRGRNVSLDEVN